MVKPSKRIPYGISDFIKLRTENYYYVDKTSFIAKLERAGDYLFLIRPRRFGKSLWLSVLECYYDIARKEPFQQLFGDTYIAEHPTENKNSYLILRFDFSLINPDTRYVETSFEAYGNTIFQFFLEKYKEFFDADHLAKLNATPKIADKLNNLFACAAAKGLRIFLLIDEYDNFSNTILATEGVARYRTLTHGTGFFRYFFSLFKGGAGLTGCGLSRLFITGVSPITMDDVTSGFNIGKNISLDPRFNELLGFTWEESLALLEYYRDHGLFQHDLDQTKVLMSAWYDGYRFSGMAKKHMFNSDMVLYFMDHVIEAGVFPDELIDHNVRIDYGKLRHLVLTDRQMNGNFSHLKAIMENGEAVVRVQVSFPVERLIQPENFISLLFYFGLLTYNGQRHGRSVLKIPNRTVWHLIYSYIRNAFQDVAVFRVDVWKLANLVGEMAYEGRWQPVFDFLAQEIHKQTSIRDYLTGEKVIQGFLLAYLNVADYFLTSSEREMGKGFVDLFLEPFLAKYPDMAFAYLVELKYIPRGELSGARLQEAITEANAQLTRYANDERVRRSLGSTYLKEIVLVYAGWELVYRGENG